MELWYTERQTPHTGITCRVRETLCARNTAFQELAVLDTFQFGRMLVLDGMVQVTEADEFIYHEMLAHVPLSTHPCPEKVLVIGGGDGGTIRETLKHGEVSRAVLVEIDREVVAACKEHLPRLSCGLEEHRAEVVFEDGIKYIKEQEETYDIILVDSPEPVGPAAGLFTGEFYRDVYKALKPGGIMVAQTESPFFNGDLIRSAYGKIKEIFPITRLYLASVPTYPSGLWSFTLGSREHDPLEVKEFRSLNTRYYNSRVHRSSFTLPGFVNDLLEGE